MWAKILQYLTGSRLRNRFTLFFIVLAAVPVLVLGGITLYLIDLAHSYDVSNLELQLLDQKIEEIEKFFVDTLGVLELRVSTDQSYIEASDQLFLLTGLLAQNRAFEEVSFTNLRGRETEKIARFQQEQMELFDVSNLEKFQEAVGGANFVGDVYNTLSGPFVTLASPVRNRNGDIIQVLSAEVDLREIVKSIELSRLGASGYAVLIDKSGTLAASGNRGIPRGADMLQYERVRKVLSGEIFDALGEQDIYESPFGRVPVVGAAKRIPRLGWGLLVEWPLQDANAIINDVRNQVLILTLFSILAVILLAPLFAARLIHPIRKLKVGAAEIEQGHFEKQVEIKTADELEELGAAFNKMALGLKRLEELREEFVFVAAHELRAPVTVIKGYISMILEGDAGPVRQTMRGYLDQVQQANERLLQLVQDLLEVARSEAGRIEIEVGPLDIRVPAGASMEELKQLAKEKSITLSYDAPLEMPQVMADERRIKEIMVNLVGNAIKYTPEKGHVWVSHAVSQTEVITRVKDDGFGISKEAQEKMFEKFYRVKTGKTRDITGTGLGLFIVKQLVEKMKGKIWFESEEGKGATFSFSLPPARTQTVDN